MNQQQDEWDAEGILALRARLGESQQAFAERVGTRQQTISEWERGTSRPARMAQRLLTLIAEAGQPAYQVGEASQIDPDEAADS